MCQLMVAQTVFNEKESIASYYMQSPEQEGSTAGG